MKRLRNPLRIAMILALFPTVFPGVTAQIRTDPDLIYVRVTAIERDRNRPIRGLLQENFKVFEDNAPQNIEYFAEDNLPLRVGVLLDVSDTVKDDVTRAVSAMTKSGSKDDYFFLLESGKAPLHGAVLQAFDALALRGSNGKRALVAITSRREPSAYPLAKIRERLKELDIQFYVTVLQMGSNFSTDSDRQVLIELTEQTGGSAFFPNATYEQTDVLKKVVAQLKNQYLLGFRSTNRTADGKWRKLKISGEYLDDKTKKKKKMDVFAKAGYYAPTAVK